MTGRWAAWALRLLRALALGLLLAPALVWAGSPEMPTDQLIVKLRGQADDHKHRSVTNELRHSLSTHAGELLEHHRTMSGGAHVLRLSKRKSLKDVEAIAAKLRSHPDVLYAVPDRIVFPQLTPNDPQFTNQWYLSANQGINAPAAWDVTTGSASVVVAVIDTGILPHADLVGHTLPGYDFVGPDQSPGGSFIVPNSFLRANDGNGRDADPTDPGSWVTQAEVDAGAPFAGCDVLSSSWHGTQLAGIIAANVNNGTGIAGINWAAKILPVRAIGKCGGYTSDIADGIRWAAGLLVNGTPANVNPAKVINLSVATAGVCDVVYQSALDDATNAGAVIVTAAGNQGQSAANFTPAACGNVITVGAVDSNGGHAAYSNTGAQVVVSAPGGVCTASPGSVFCSGGDATNGILSTANSGAQSAANDNPSVYRVSQGTSLAAAQVSGVASLMLSVNPTLKSQEIAQLLSGSARAFPNNTCTTATCGGGIVDAGAAVKAASIFGTAKPQVAAGGFHTVALKSDGTVWAWGDNNSGQLGDGTAIPVRLTPARVSSLSGITSIAAGKNHSLAVRADGTVWAWGSNSDGQVGGATQGDRNLPTRVIGLANVIAVSAGDDYSLALTIDGTVWAWGSNAHGQLGNGTAGQSIRIPVQAIKPGGGFLTGMAAIAAGGLSLALDKNDGTVWAWGNQQSTPIQVAGPLDAGGARLTGVTAIASGLQSLALRNDGTVWDISGSGFSTQVTGAGFADVTAIAGGGSHSLARKTDGTVWAWGQNFNGELGIGTADNDTHQTPTQVVGLAGGFLSGVVAIAAGGASAVQIAGGGASFALKTDGTVLAWGGNSGVGKLGDGTVTDRSFPVQVLATGAGDFLTGVVRAAVGNRYSFALRAGSPLLAWGGFGRTVLAPYGMVPQPMRGPGGVGTLIGVTAIGAGNDHVVTVRAGGTLWAWGINTNGQVGDGTTTTQLSPTQIPAFSNFTDVAAGRAHSLALRNDNTLWAWGDNSSGQLGDGTTTQRNSPVQVPSLSGVTAVAAGANHTLALLSNGTVWAWGDNSAGQLGDNTTTQRATPVQVPGLSGITAIAAGANHSVARKNDGTLWTWGDNSFGQLGDGSNTHRLVPVLVTGITDVTAIAAGSAHTLAITVDRLLWSWGNNDNGQLGDGGIAASRNRPATVAQLTGVTGVAMGAMATHSLVFLADGSLYAFGGPPAALGVGLAADAPFAEQPLPLPVIGSGGGGFLNLGVSDPTVFAMQTDAAVATVATSNAVTLSGIGNGVAISISPGAEYSINGSPFTSASGIVKDGDVVTVRVTSSGSFGTPATVTLTVGGVPKTFTVTTVAADATPAPFAFSPQAGVAPGVVVTSNSIAVSGISAPAQISIVGGVYSVNGSTTFTNASGTVNNGDVVVVRQSASTSNDTLTIATLTIGGVSAAFNVITRVTATFYTPPQLAAGSIHVMALRSDGTPFVWGLNSLGALGDGSAGILIRATPVPVVGLSGVMAIAAGSGHSLALRTDGGVWAWGDNTVGILGDGTTIPRGLPVQVRAPGGVGLLGGITAIAAGGSHSLALKNDGTVWGWGRNDSGVLGNNTTVSSAVPVQASVPTGVIAIATSTLHSLALVSDGSGTTGTVWAWGSNATGQLGDGTIVDKLVPTPVPGLTGVKAIVAGNNYSIALKSNGTVWAWGDNSFGQLGDGSTTRQLAPVQVTGLNGIIAVTAIAAAGSSYAVKADGTVWAWGSNSTGELGDGTTTPRFTPVQVLGPGGNGFLLGVKSVTAGGGFALGLKFDGAVWAWGNENSLALGDGLIPGVGTNLIRSSPAQVLGVGGNGFLNLGVGDPANFAAQTDIAAATLVTSNAVTLAEIGTNVPISIIDGLFSVNGAPVTNLPTTVKDGDIVTVRVTASANFGVTTTATLTVGGINKTFSVTTAFANTAPAAFVFNSQAGVALGTVVTSNSITVSGINAPAPISIVGGLYSVNGLTFTNALGTVKNGDVVVVQQTVSASPNTLTAATLTIGGVSATFDVITRVDATTAVPVIRRLAADDLHAVALRSDGTALAWGINIHGQLGDGTRAGGTVPVQVKGLSGIKAVGAAETMTFALRTDGTVWAWGAFTSGPTLGDGTRNSSNFPVQVVGPGGVGYLSGIVDIAASGMHTLALRCNDGTCNDGTGTVWAWGSNFSGQLGDGTYLFIHIPARTWTGRVGTHGISYGCQSDCGERCAQPCIKNRRHRLGVG